MLELRDYSIAELRTILGTKDKQGIDRKLTGYGVEFSSSGYGDSRVYTVTRIPDPFKIYAITKLGIPAQADFTKIQNLYFYFFCVEGFAEWPLVEMEAILAEDFLQDHFQVAEISGTFGICAVLPMRLYILCHLQSQQRHKALQRD